MARLIFTSLSFLMLLLSSYKEKNIEDEKHQNFIAAIENDSTFNFFTVIKAKDINTGIVKEICTKGNFVSGALHIELNADYDYKGRQRVLAFAKSKKDRYFEFKNKKALDNISFYKYDPNYLVTIQNKFRFNNIEKDIEQNRKFSIRLPDREMKAFAHVLFNKGFISGSKSILCVKIEPRVSS